MAKTASATTKVASVTPMMRQYFEIKSQYEDAILFYRLGDFYEMFNQDAVEASQILDLTLTQRNKNSDNPVPLCGIPYHAADAYIAKLVSSGRKVAVCEQTEDPKKAKGLVKRDVTRVITPGTVLEEQSLPARSNNFLMGILPVGEEISCTVCDISTGDLEYFRVKNSDQLADEIARLQVREVFYPENDQTIQKLDAFLQVYPNLYHHSVSSLFLDEDYAEDLIKTQYKVSSVESLGIESKTVEVKALGMLLGYLNDSKLLQADLLSQPVERLSDRFMIIDEMSVRNLELFRTLRDDQNKGTLLWHMDSCETPMGSRVLAEFMRTPLLDPKEIEKRLDAVENFVEDSELLEHVQGTLKGIADLERLANKFIVKSANARDAMSLRESFECIPFLKKVMSTAKVDHLHELNDQIEDFDRLAVKIQRIVKEEPPISLREGGIIADGYNVELDDLREIEKSGKDIIAQMEAKEKERTGIPSLKIRYNNVFGYYIEVTNTHKDKVPEGYIRKQTLTNAERYITDELKTYESKVLGAGERIKTLEYDLFCELRDEIQLACVDIKRVARSIAVVDVLQGFAGLAVKFGYKRPRVSKGTSLRFSGARHPILERMNQGEPFVPNDIELDQKQNTVLIITGPNMAGKSTIMRMTALLAIMAQMGCFIPVDSADVGVCDRVFTRVGAHDHLQKGMSTFMVEMVETAKILREATGKSLILLDEIGRGTSTFDGLSIAWSVAEDLHDRLSARTLFATHYHELCDLADQKRGVKNFHMSVKEWNNEIIFLRKLKPGGTNRSYGVAVASMAGLPVPVVSRAKEILRLLEVKDLSFKSDMDEQVQKQMSLFQANSEPEVVTQLRDVDINDMTPLQALQFLNELKTNLKAS